MALNQNCGNCGRGDSASPDVPWCSFCRTNWPAAYTALMNPTTDSPEAKYPMDLVTREYFDGPFVKPRDLMRKTGY